MHKNIKMALTNAYIQERLKEKFGDLVYNFEDTYGMLSFEAPKDQNLKVMQFLFERCAPELAWKM